MRPVPTQTATPIPTDSGAVAGFVLGVVSMGGLLFPPMLGVAVMGVILSWTARRRIARNADRLRGTGLAVTGLVLSVLGCALSLVIPGIIAFVYIYAAFHGGQLP